MSQITKELNKIRRRINDLEEMIIKMEVDDEKDIHKLDQAYRERLRLFKLYRRLQHAYPIKSAEWDILRELEKNLQIRILHINDVEENNIAYYSSNKNGISELVIRDSHFSTIPESICELTSLRKLILINNKISHFPESFTNLEFLKELNLNSNSIHHLPDFISNLRLLKILVLSNNKLTQLPESLFNLEFLTHLSLDNNKLDKISKSISKLKNLDSLNLNGNKLTFLPNSFSELRGLFFMDLRNNFLTEAHLPFIRSRDSHILV